MLGIVGLFGIASIAGVICGALAIERAAAAGQRSVLAWWGLGVSVATALGAVAYLTSAG